MNIGDYFYELIFDFFLRNTEHILHWDPQQYNGESFEDALRKIESQRKKK